MDRDRLFGGCLDCVFKGKMVSTDKLAYSLLLYKKRRLYLRTGLSIPPTVRFTVDPSRPMPKYGKSTWLSL